MASLREIKDRIGSVKSTLKITSAMKLVASAKLRKAQQAIESLLPYEKTLYDILSLVSGNNSRLNNATNPSAPLAIVAVASDSSLCGGFNANIIRYALAEAARHDDVIVYPVGRKMVEALKKTTLRLEYTKDLAADLKEKFDKGEISGAMLVYTHYVSTSCQKPVTEQYLPFCVDTHASEGDRDCALDKYIVEPSPESIVSALLPQLLTLKIKAVLLDSQAAEQAARTIAMQTASDNAEDILEDLTLQYNKGRQQKITSEILDLLGGIAQQ